MCGFVGCIHDNEVGLRETDRQLFKNMNDIITHRGPDDEGFLKMSIFNLVSAD